MARAGIDPNKWRILESNREYMRVVQKKTGKTREIDLGGKVVRRSSDHDAVSEGLARSLRARGKAEA